jgi:hypothetical protein
MDIMALIGMSEHCCHNMDHFTKRPEERAKSGFWAAIGEDPTSLPPPLIEYRPTRKIYAFQSVALFYCPWCGTKLPEISKIT